MRSGSAVYLDSSAIVKLIVGEAASADLRTHLLDWPIRISCIIARVEVIRAVRRVDQRALARARYVLEGIELLALNPLVLDAAEYIEPGIVRTLDALHLAAAQSLGDELAQIITYDGRMANAAVNLGLTVISPGMPG